MAGQNLNRSFPVLDFTSADAASMIQDLTAHAQANFSDRWTSFHAGGIAVVQRDLQAYQFDMLMFYLNALLNETFSATALRRNNLIKIGRGYEYVVPSAVPYLVDVTCTLNPVGVYPATIAAATTSFRNTKGTATFTPVADVLVPSYPVGGTVVVAATQGERVTAELLATSTASRDQRYKLVRSGLIDGSLVVTVNGVPWTKVINIVNSDTTDEHYMILTNDRDETFVQFGDGQYGKVPPGGNQIRASYRVLGESQLAGAVSRDTVTQFTTASGVISSVNNLTDATGGGPRPPLRQIRAAIPASLIAHNGLLHEVDVAAAARQVSGVAKARASEEDILFRRLALTIAPVGGGLPTSSLKSQVSTALRPNRSLGLRTIIRDPVYKNVKMELLVHAERNVNRDTLKALFRSACTTAEGTGAFDFDQVDFAGLDPDDEDNLQVSVDRLNSIADDLRSSGVKRLEVRTLTVMPEARRLSSTSGDGTVTGVATPTNDHLRREYLIRFNSALTYVVKERILGTVAEIQLHTLFDDRASLPSLVSEGYTRLIPDRTSNAEVPISGNTATLISTAPSSASLFELTEVGSEYVVERDVPITGTVGVPFEVLSQDGAVLLTFTVNVGASPWNSGDELVLDTFAPVQDIVLRADEIPQLLDTNLDIQVSGGVA